MVQYYPLYKYPLFSKLGHKSELSKYEDFFKYDFFLSSLDVRKECRILN